MFLFSFPFTTLSSIIAAGENQRVQDVSVHADSAHHIVMETRGLGAKWIIAPKPWRQ